MNFIKILENYSFYLKKFLINFYQVIILNIEYCILKYYNSISKFFKFQSKRNYSKVEVDV